MTVLVRIFAGGCLMLVLTAAAVVLSALWLASRPPPRPAGAIVVLGGAMGPNLIEASETSGRVRAGVALWKAGLAPRIHFTGGAAEDGRPGAGDRMLDLAVALGVPRAAASAENRSRSTLQNALFSQPILGPLAEGPVIVVSDGYHLARAWASFRWAGYPVVRLAAASAFGEQTPMEQAERVGRETLAWWFNAARVAVWEIVAKLTGKPPGIDMLQ